MPHKACGGQAAPLVQPHNRLKQEEVCPGHTRQNLMIGFISACAQLSLLGDDACCLWTPPAPLPNACWLLHTTGTAQGARRESSMSVPERAGCNAVVKTRFFKCTPIRRPCLPCLRRAAAVGQSHVSRALTCAHAHSLACAHTRTHLHRPRWLNAMKSERRRHSVCRSRVRRRAGRAPRATGRSRGFGCALKVTTPAERPV